MEKMTKHEEGVRLLEEMEDLLYKIEKGTATRPILALARVVWWLLREWVKEHK